MEISVSEPWFSLIKNGQKTVEGRKNKSPWNTLVPGDLIIFKNGENKIICLVSEIRIYHKGFIDNLNPLTRYLKKETLKKTLPGIKTIKEGEKIYLQWSTLSEILEYGFLGIHFTVI